MYASLAHNTFEDYAFGMDMQIQPEFDLYSAGIQAVCLFRQDRLSDGCQNSHRHVHHHPDRLQDFLLQGCPVRIRSQRLILMSMQNRLDLKGSF